MGAAVETDTEEAGGGGESKRAMRRKIMSSENFNRRGFKDTKEDAAGMMVDEFTSSLLVDIKKVREAMNVYKRGDVTVRLAEAYGFCWGVERAVAIAYETRKQFPNEKIWITNEIIHNPLVNQRLKEMNVYFVPEENMKKDLSGIGKGDVVVLPAFGATLQEMNYLDNLGCQIVDTTCPWVSKVWNALDKHRRADCTSIIHGKWKHEETIATVSMAETYLIILNLEQAEYVCNYILNGGDKEEFLKKFENCHSEGFDPETDLVAVGVANQTTMLKSETEAMAKMFEKCMLRKYGPQDLNAHFVSFNTICDATQERQDAMFDLLKEPLDLMIVVGGFNSSNTSHLQEIPEKVGMKSFWVDSPECVGPGNKIIYRMSDGTEIVEENFLPKGPVTIGVTSGASTPDKVLEDVLERIFLIHAIDAEVPEPAGVSK